MLSRIIAGQLPGRFVRQDPEITEFLTTALIAARSHTLVVPRREVDRWTDADGVLLGHCVEVAQAIGQVCSGFGAPCDRAGHCGPRGIASAHPRVLGGGGRRRLGVHDRPESASGGARLTGSW
ncbi:HIT family protein [Streptomyces canus]|uniref:HIT family protein n=1 Tax=Streptomyces canus TaxID=58343 RepID=UPI0037D9CF47